ncbi:MAG: hypothetical protein GY855_00040, partial [candidate division Zixibacteria bacterium]|nr:hypothetical protein [candidate division Zixibacteria bacterium]
MKRLLVLVLVSVLVFMSSAMASRYEFNFDPGNIQFSSDQYGDVLEIEGCHLTGNSGDPFIPVKVGHVAADFGAEITGIKILEENWIELPAVYNLRPAPTPVPISYTGILPDVIPNDEIYTSESAYPSSPIQFTGGNKMRGYSLGGFMIYPLRYYPLSGRVEVLDRLVIELEYDNSFTAFTPSLEFGSVVARLVENPEVVQAQSMILSPVDPNDVKYLIITSSSLEPAFQALVEWYTRAGWPAESITLSEIQGSYPGDTDQLKTKACIQDYAENKGTLFVLIGGDDTIIPDQNCWGDVNNGGTTDNTIPTDLFLAGFDEEYDWNYDGDGKVGEVGDGYDLYPEVFISRAPVRTASHTEAFVNKTLNYIINQPDINFIDPMLLSGVELWNTWGGHSDADWRCEYMWEDYISFAWENHNRVRFYDTETDFGGPGYNVTPAHLQDLLNDGYHYFFMGTHGNQSGWGMEWYNGFESSHALDLMNEFNQGIIYTMACITNGFDSEGGYNYDPCLSEAFIRNSDGGAVGYQGCSRYGWGWANQSPNHGPSLQYADEFYMCLFFGDTHGNLPGDYPYRLAAASATHKAIKAPECQSQGVMRWLNFGINSVGDPALDLYTENPITMYPSYEKL